MLWDFPPGDVSMCDGDCQGSPTMTNCLSWAKMQNLMLFSTEHLVVSLGD